MICFPNAKINLGLCVTEKRTDGYHNLETVFYPVKICDVLELLPGNTTSLHLNGLAIAGSTEQNLVWKAWQLLHSGFPEKVEPVAFHLLKHIPMGAGLGGGSSDGSFALMALDRMFQLQLSRQQLMDYALQLGSDCPFFIDNIPSVAYGRGEILHPLPLNLDAYCCHLVCPDVHISTKEAFAGLSPRQPDFSLKDLAAIPLTAWKDRVHNDFESTAFAAYPVLAAIKEQLYRAGAVFALMSGTGSTVYGLFPKGYQEQIDITSGACREYTIEL